MKRKKISLRKALEGFAEKRGISTRLLILFIVLFAVAVTLAPPTQHYFAQRAQISSLQADAETQAAFYLSIRAYPQFRAVQPSFHDARHDHASDVCHSVIRRFRKRNNAAANRCS